MNKIFLLLILLLILACKYIPSSTLIRYPDRLGEGKSIVLTQSYYPNKSHVHGQDKIEWTIQNQFDRPPINWYFMINRRTSSFASNPKFFFEFADTVIICQSKKLETIPHSIKTESTTSTVDTAGNLLNTSNGTYLSEWIVEKGILIPDPMLRQKILNTDYTIVAGWSAGPHQIVYDIDGDKLNKLKSVLSKNH